VTVSPNSPVVGRPLYTLNPKKWLVGAVYRDNEIIIPHGSTVLKKNDRVLVIGELDMVPAVISFLGSGTPQFPLQFGSLIAIPFLDSKDEGFFQEAILLARQTKAGGIFILNWGRQERLQDSLLELCEGQCVPTQVAGMQGKFCEATLAEIRRRDVGCIVLPRSKRSFWPGRTPRTKDVMRIVNESFQPCLFPAGTFPYKKILVAITESESSLRGVELAIDIARLLGAKLTAVNVIPPRFIAGEESAEQQKQALSKALEIASMHHVKIESMTLEGNPVVELKKAQAGFDLMILTHRPGRGRSLLTPDVSEHLITKSNISILVLPFFDRENGS